MCPMMSPAVKQQYYEFYQDQERLLSSPSLELAAQLERKWKKLEPSLYRVLQEDIERVRHQPAELSPVEKSGKPLPTIRPALTAEKPAMKKLLPAPAAQQQVPPLYQPTVNDISLFFDRQGVVGEEATRQLLLYAALGKVHVGIESLPGCGKTTLLFALKEALPPPSYKLLQQASEKALFNDPDLRRGKIDYLMITEYQKVIANPQVEEIVKNLAEGISSTYIRTNSRRTGIEKLEIKVGTLLYTFAITNKHAKSKEQDGELARRFLVLHTDISKEQNERVVDEKALRRLQGEAEPDTTELTGQETTEFQQYIARCVARPYSVQNLFFPMILRQLPEELRQHAKMRTFEGYLQKLVTGSTLFHHAGRPGEGTIRYSTISDNLRVLTLDPYLIPNNIHKISAVERALFNSMELGQEYSEEQLVESLLGFDDRGAVVRKGMERLQQLGYLKEIAPKAYLREKADHVMFDWEEVYEKSKQGLADLPAALAERLQQCCQQELEELL